MSTRCDGSGATAGMETEEGDRVATCHLCGKRVRVSVWGTFYHHTRTAPETAAAERRANRRTPKPTRRTK